MFKVGDRVIVVSDIDFKLNIGYIGTVLEVRTQDGVIIDDIGVEFDRCIYGHSLNYNKGKEGHCWYCLPRYIELLDDSLLNDEPIKLEV